MKLKNITKEQKERIEKYGIGKKIFECEEAGEWVFDEINKHWINPEIKRTIKRIEDEIKFLTKQFDEMKETKKYSEKGNEFDRGFDSCIDIYGNGLINRRKIIKKELEDYKLMEQLE